MNPYAVWLYGSESRGDASPSSDVDILMIGEGSLPPQVSRSFQGRRISVSRYGWAEVGRMAGYGSLFLHHLRAEARVLHESPTAAGRLRAILNDLPHYQRAHRDVRAFRQTLLDISAELPDPPDLEFELSTLAALTRRIGILGSYLLGRPRFGRIGPVTQVVEAWKLPDVFSSEFPEFYRHRLAAERADSVTTLPNAAALALWIERAGLMLDRLEVQAHESCRLVHH